MTKATLRKYRDQILTEAGVWIEGQQTLKDFADRVEGILASLSKQLDKGKKK